MAAGKSIVGRRLAQRLERAFIDTDFLIEEREGTTIADIFEKHGEDGFRSVEREVIEGLRPDSPAVIATGGGTFVDEENRRRLKRMGVVVSLVTSLDTVIERISRAEGARPLATADREKLGDLLASRMPAYRMADIIVETDGLGVEQAVSRVLSMVEPRLRTTE
jgi:shikimate kinase